VPAHLDRLGVTSREVDVLRLVADGLSNAQIAQRLYLSPATVKGYVEQLLAKTGSANRTQLATRLTADAPAAGSTAAGSTAAGSTTAGSTTATGAPDPPSGGSQRRPRQAVSSVRDGAVPPRTTEERP
jgi:DNA-binding CsgD family transcriptional regulator